MMKDKNVAALLAFFLGTFGIHRFYLGQIGLGIAYALFFWTGIPAILGFIDAIVLFAMDRDRFDMKYNWEYYRSDVRRRRERDFDRREWEMRRRRERDTDFDRRRRQREKDIEQWHSRQRQRNGEAQTERKQRANEQKRWQEQQRERALTQKKTTYKQVGIRKFKDYDYDAAIEQFKKVLDIDVKDVPTHFNLACAYSLNENAERSFHHLDQAVQYGFSDFKKIKEHDALAFLRIQPQFEEFEQNGFRLAPAGELEEEEENQQLDSLEEGEDDLLQSSPDLLDQLQKLGELRDKGLLTEEEFDVQKKKLLN